MAHYAFLDSNSIVVDVIVGRDPGNDSIDWEQRYGEIRGLACKQTSYRTRGGSHPDGNPFRMNYAGIGFLYDKHLDAFIPPKPFSDWILNTSTCLWEPPVPMPADGSLYRWSEDQKTWLKQ